LDVYQWNKSCYSKPNENDDDINLTMTVDKYESDAINDLSIENPENVPITVGWVLCRKSIIIHSMFQESNNDSQNVFDDSPWYQNSKLQNFHRTRYILNRV